MRLNLFESDLIDEMVIEGCSIRVNKIGCAKYLFEVLVEKNFKFELWTTRKGFIEFNLISADIPDWLSVQSEYDPLTNLAATGCNVQIEHCDRGLYYVEISRNQESSCLQISTKGYLKAKLITPY